MPPLTSFSTLVLLLTMLPQTFLLPTASAASSSFTPTIDGDAEVLNRLFLSLSMEPLHTSWEVNDRKRKSKNKNKRGQQQQQEEEGALPPTVKWTEGPVPLWDGRLMFSDTILAKIFIWSPRGFLEEFLTNAGDAPKGDGVDRAEPGSNGLAVFDNNEILACQHGRRRLVKIDITSKARRVVAAVAPGGKRLNGPNDVALSADKKSAYFTDAVYAFLDNDRFADLPYLDELVKSNGTGATAVWRAALEAPPSVNRRNGEHLELVTDALSRPNGVALEPPRRRETEGAGAEGKGPPPERLWVSDCCQGDHNSACKQGTSRWVAFERSSAVVDGNESPWEAVATVEDVNENLQRGCADGFAFHEATGLLVGSCAGGVCVVDPSPSEGEGGGGGPKLLARLRTTDGSQRGGGGGIGTGFRVSNVAFSRDTAFFTGEGGVWRLPMRTARGSYGGEL
jgi:hypothetical protein